MISNNTISKLSAPKTLQCPKGYKICTDNIQDIFDYSQRQTHNNETNKTCIPNPLKYKVNLFAHNQGDWQNFTNHTYPNVVHSKSFHLHRFYYSITPTPKYMVLMNSPSTCNLGRDDHDNMHRIKGQLALNYSYFHPYQCNLHLQNKSSTNITVKYSEYSKWYPDNDNYIDMITANDVYTLRTDLYDQCSNEGYTPRECCGQNKPINKERWRNVRLAIRRNPKWIKKLTFMLNIAQSKGYFHFFVESLPRLAPFIYTLKNIALYNVNNSKNIFKVFINLGGVRTPKQVLRWLFRKEKDLTISYGKSYRDYPKFTKKVIQPHVTTCEWARERGSRLLNKILRNEIKIYAKENGINIIKPVGVKNIVLLKRNSGRRIKNLEKLKKRIEAEYNDKEKYNLYVHDDKRLDNFHPFGYYVEFYKADIVIGAFGAGMVNIAFSKPGTAVILIQGSHHKNHRMYMAHSMALGMRYYAYYTDTKWRMNVDEIMQVIRLYI